MAHLHVRYAGPEQATLEVRQLLAEASKPIGHSAGGLGRDFAHLARTSRLDIADTAERFRQLAMGERVAQVSLRPDQALLERLRNCDRAALERGLTEATARALAERLPKTSGIFATRWDGSSPVVDAYLAGRAVGRGTPDLDRADIAAIEVAWSNQLQRAFRLDRIDRAAQRAATDPPQRLLVPVREILPNVTQTQLGQQTFRGELYRRIANFTNSILGRPAYIDFAERDGQTHLVIHYNSALAPQDLSRQIADHLREPQRVPEVSPDRRTRFDVLRVRITNGAQAFADYPAEDLRRLAREAVRRAGAVDPRRTLLVTPYIRGNDVLIVVMLNPRAAQERSGPIDPTQLRRLLDERLAQRLTEDALRYDSRQRGLHGALGHVFVERVPEERFKREEYRLRHPEAPVAHLPEPIVTDPTRILKTPEWLKQPLDSFVVRLALGHEILRQLDPQRQRELLQATIDRVYPAFGAAGIRDNYTRATGPNGELEVKIFFPRGVIASPGPLADRDSTLAFARAFNDAARERGAQIPEQALNVERAATRQPTAPAIDHAAGAVAFGVRTWQRIRSLEYLTEDPGRALATELQARFGHPAAIINMARKSAKVIEGFSRLSSLLPPTPVTTAARVVGHAVNLVSRAVPRER